MFTVKDYEEAGAYARRHFHEIISNPYVLGTVEFCAWDRGWDMADTSIKLEDNNKE
jgi:hypothetical protein